MTMEDALNEIVDLQERERNGKPVDYRRWDELEAFIRDGYEEEAKKYDSD